MDTLNGVRIDGRQIKFRRRTSILSIAGKTAFAIVGLIVVLAVIVLNGGLPN